MGTTLGGGGENDGASRPKEVTDLRQDRACDNRHSLGTSTLLVEPPYQGSTGLPFDVRQVEEEG